MAIKSSISALCTFMFTFMFTFITVSANAALLPRLEIAQGSGSLYG